MLVVSTLTVFTTLVILVPRMERSLGGKAPANFLAARIRHDDPHQRAAIVVCGKLPLGLPFYLEQTVWWQRPATETANASDPASFEYNTAASDAQNIIETPVQLKALLTGPNPVYCVAVTKE